MCAGAWVWLPAHGQTASLLYCFTTSLLYFFPASLVLAYFLPRVPLLCPPLLCFFVTLLPGYLLHWQFNSTFPCGNSVVNVVLPTALRASFSRNAATWTSETLHPCPLASLIHCNLHSSNTAGPQAESGRHPAWVSARVRGFGAGARACMQLGADFACSSGPISGSIWNPCRDPFGTHFETNPYSFRDPFGIQFGTHFESHFGPNW